MTPRFVLFAPGAGAPSTSPWIERWAKRLAPLGDVVRFDYPYEDRPQDRGPAAGAASVDARLREGR